MFTINRRRLFAFLSSIMFLLINCKDVKNNPQLITSHSLVTDSTQKEITINHSNIVKAYDVGANDQADISLEFYTDSTFTLFFQQFPFPDEPIKDPSDTLLYKLDGSWCVKNEKYILLLNQNNEFDLKALFEPGDGIELMNGNTFSFDKSRDTISIWGFDCTNRKL